MKSIIPTFILAAFIAFMPACKKDRHTTKLSYRLKQVKNSAEYKTFVYDNKNRLSRIDFNTGSYRVDYAETGVITAQVYASDGTPDPNWKYVFNSTNNRIKKGTRYMSNGAVGREFFYEYDHDGRLWSIMMSLKDFTDAEAEDHRYYFSYDDNNNLNKVTYTRANWFGSEKTNSDSASIALSYYTDKPFINWKQTGFDFFGNVAGGIQLIGFEIVPFSFFFLEQIILSEKAVQAIDTKKYRWNPGSGTWSSVAGNTQTFEESDYHYNGNGLIEKYKDMGIVWEPYEE